jgi:hypothetical protein
MNYKKFYENGLIHEAPIEDFGVHPKIKGTIFYPGSGIDLSDLLIFPNAKQYIHQDYILGPEEQVPRNKQAKKHFKGIK